MSKPTSHASSLQISHAPPLTAHTGDADLKVINDADLLDLSDFSIDIADGERLRAAWLDPESYDYVEVSAVMSVRELDNGDEDPVVYRVLKINQDIEGVDGGAASAGGVSATAVESPLVSVSSDGRISVVNGEIVADGVVVAWRPGRFAHVTTEDGLVVTCVGLALTRLPGGVAAVRVSPLLGDPFLVEVSKVRRLVGPGSMIVGCDGDGSDSSSGVLPTDETVVGDCGVADAAVPADD